MLNEDNMQQILHGQFQIQNDVNPMIFCLYLLDRLCQNLKVSSVFQFVSGNQPLTTGSQLVDKLAGGYFSIREDLDGTKKKSTQFSLNI